MSLKQGVSLVGILLFCFLIAFISGNMFFSIGNSSAASKSVDVIANIDEVLAITTITTDAINGELILDIMPTPGGTLAKSQLTVTVSTNNATGYVLNMNSLTTNTSMAHEAATGSPPAPNIPSTNHLYNTPATLATNTWGWNLGTASTTTTFSKIPPSNDSQTIRTTSEPSSVSTPELANTIITFAANATDTLPAGNYTNTIVFTATSNYTPPPSGNWAINDAAAKITTFDEHGVLTSTMGLVPIDYTNSTTYTNTTTQTIGRNNYSIIHGYLNSKQQIDVDGKYYLEAPTGSTTQMLNGLVAGDSVRIRGVGDNHEFVIKRRVSSYALFEFNVPVSIYVQNVDFEAGHDIPAPNENRIFRYMIQQNWATTDFLIDEIIVRDCSFEGPIKIVVANATAPAGYAEDKLDPSRHVIDKVAIHNNTITNSAVLNGVVNIDNPYVKEFRVTNNTIRNSGWSIINFTNDNVGNTDVDGTTDHNYPNRPSLFYIDENEYINDDNFDMWLAWKDAQEDTSAPWGDRSTWWGSTTSLYFSFIVHKGALDVVFTNNHIEGLNSWGTATKPVIYTAYLSGQRVLYENNVSKNIMLFDASKPLEGTEMFKFKAAYIYPDSNRIVRDNKFIIEEDFPERILGAGKLGSMSQAEILDMLSLRISHMNTPWETFVFENNFIDVPSLFPYYISDFYSIQHFSFNNNIINAKYLRSWSNNAYASFVILAPASAMPVGVTNLTRTMKGNTIDVAYANNADPAGTRRNIVLIAGTSTLPSVVTVEDNTFNMGELSYIFADRLTIIAAHGTSDIPNMTLNFNNNVVTTKPPGNINKKDVASAGTTVFNQFNGNTTSPSFNFIGSN